MENDIDVYNANKNINLYKKYKAFSYDFVFYYAVEILFYTVVKGFKMSEFMYLCSFYTFSAFVWQLFGSMIVEKLGLKKSVILGNIFVIINLFLFLIGKSFFTFIFANFFMALGFSLKGLSEGSLLYSSLKKVGKRDQFSKVEGKANSKYYYFDGIASFISGFLFVVNGYLPFIFCLVCCIIGLSIAFRFEDFKKEEDYEESISLKNTLLYFKETTSSNRTKAILLFAFVFWGIISVICTLYKAIILDIGIKEQYSTIIICIMTIFVGFGSRSFYGIERITKNKTLTVFSYALLTSSIVISIMGVWGNLNLTSLSVILIALAIIGMIQGAYRVAIKKYVLSFTTSQVRIKITSAYYIAENLGKCLIQFLTGFLLEFTSNSISCLIFSLVSAVVLVSIIKYMKGKVGLKPEQYLPQDINNVKV